MDNDNLADRDTHDSDFTEKHYAELLALAKSKYRFISYDKMAPGDKFILWRHDCDFSLDRARRLAEIEKDAGIQATYFIHLHCEYYNPLERSQANSIEEILALGHNLGLHFDASYWGTSSKADLDRQVSFEAEILNRFFGTKISAFSFHNPTEFTSGCEDETYGGLINCYSRTFKNEVSYCSDSNGYWRFSRLWDVLEKAAHPRLQVLTHPAWWQDRPMPPRQRIFRGVFGRAAATMRFYDSTLETFSRRNLAGHPAALQFLRPVAPAVYGLCDYLWNQEQYAPLFLELWRLHQRQIDNLCRRMMEEQGHAETDASAPDGGKAFSEIAGLTLCEATGTSGDPHRKWDTLSQRLVSGDIAPGPETESECVRLCQAIQALGNWGAQSTKFRCDGIEDYAAR